MKDVTSDEMSYILNTPYRNNEFKIQLESMLTIFDVTDNEN